MNSKLWMIPPDGTAGKHKPAITVYRSIFHLEQERKFHLLWTADEHAELFLNGKFLCAGPGGSTAKCWHLEELETTLPPGDHVLTARVTMFGKKLVPYAEESIEYGFFAASDLTEKWECQVMEGVEYSPSFPDWAVAPRMDVPENVNWEILEGRGGIWKPVTYRMDPRVLSPHAIPPMEEKPICGYKIIDRKDGSLLFVFDDYVCAWDDFRFRGRGTVTIRWSESFYYPGTFNNRELTGNKGDRAVLEGKEWIGNGTTLHLPGGSVRWRDCEWKSGRYLLLEFTGDAELESIELTSTGYPWKREWRLNSSDPGLDHAVELAWNTFRKCSHETFIDCPFFERLQYISDSRLESLIALAVTRDTRLVMESLRNFADNQAENGLIFSRIPSKMPQIIPSFALVYVLFLRDVAEWRSPELVREFIPCARKILAFFEKQAGKNGLVHFPGWDAVDTPDWKPGDKGWNFIDWVDGWDNGVPPGSCTLNIFRLLALEAMSELDRENAGCWRDSARSAAEMIRRAYEVPGKGFAENEEKTVFSEHAQCLAVLSENLPDYSPDIPGAAQCSISFSCYYLEAVRKLKRGDLFMDRISKWFAAEREGLRTLPENFDGPRSDCHGWSAHILYHCFASVLGLRPVDAADGIWEVDPFPCGLAFLEGEVPLGDGMLKFRLEGEKLTFENTSSCILRRRSE